MLCVTMNYDDSLERAFQEADEPYDLVTYIAEWAAPGEVPPHRPRTGQAPSSQAQRVH